MSAIETTTVTPIESPVTFSLIRHPPHYTSSKASCPSCGHPIECIDITQHMNFNLGNAVKYIWRCDLKSDAVQDLEKAAWYINREIELRKKVKKDA